MRNYFPIRPSGAPLHTLSKLYDAPFGFVTPPPYFEAVNCFICGRRRVAVARYRMICLVLINMLTIPFTGKSSCQPHRLQISAWTVDGAERVGSQLQRKRHGGQRLGCPTVRTTVMVRISPGARHLP